ncbi:SYF1 Pre-mRNA-splicing factor SYF1 [Candida maltosa Xu316]|uniref:Pre-mRNA-splicing factor SYF1 n=1 Tax=Candida maltosa (strain Xu316) TaxID=1245528 RepID=M3J4R6_CANMX|nr:hypothetical protein G210_2704 [Candida maltosa Xu316]
MEIDNLIRKEHIPYEEQLSKTPNDIPTWIAYYNFLTDFEPKLFILHRAVTYNPTASELWKLFLDLLLQDDNIHPDTIVQVYDRALRHLSQDIDLWVQYLRYLLSHSIYKVTFIRRKFNQCLQNLPLIEHESIWIMYLEFADIIGGITGIKVYLKYLQVLDVWDNERGMTIIDVIHKLIEFGGIFEPIMLYRRIIDNPTEYMNLPESITTYLFEYIDLLTDPKSDIGEEGFIDMINKAMIEYPDQFGKLYIKLTYFLTNRNNPERARHYYAKGIIECTTLPDFVMIYDKYLEFEEDELVKMADTKEIESLYLDEFESLIDDRKLLINDTLLRQDINNLDAWFTRFDFYKDDLNKLIQSLTQAIRSINPLKVKSVKSHKLSDVWLKYIDIYSSRNDLKTADFIFSKSVLSQYIDVDELADLYIKWCEMVLGSDEFPEKQAIEILDNVLHRQFDDNDKTVQSKLVKNKKIKEFYKDLVDSFSIE